MVTTHPSVLAGCTRLLREAGAQVRFGDSPGLDNPTYAARRSGLLEAGVRSGAEFAEFSTGSRMANPEGTLVSSFPVAQAVHECDGIINLPKMKTEGHVSVTLSIKNLFGVPQRAKKSSLHRRLNEILPYLAGVIRHHLQNLRPRASEKGEASH